MTLPERRGPIRTRRGAKLPHWTAEGGTYSVTFRLGDSLPAPVLERWRRARALLLKQLRAGGAVMTAADRAAAAELFASRIDAYLDAGSGSCILRDPRAASIVRESLLHFDGERYRLRTWCVMPNHVHAVVEPLGVELASVLHTWKSFTSHQINRELGCTGNLWQAESFDHLVRDEADLARAARYVLSNPNKAGLRAWPWVGADEEMYKMLSRTAR